MINTLFLLILINGVSGKIQGIVLDEATNEPIPYANVITLKTELGTATDQDGTFFIFNVLPNIYTVEISCVGYQTQQIKDV
ncbi:MAG: carboxypeptidase-like regulatory domain-containing protein, partial [bacterium]